MHSRVGIAAAAALALTMASGCTSTSTKTGVGGAGLTLNGAGATFPYPIYSKWFQAYHQTHPNVTFNYQAVGSGAGIAQYQAGTVDFGASDAPLTDEELGKMPVRPVHIPTVAGAVVVAYNIPGVGPGLRLTGDVIADLFLGTIRAWNDPRIAALNPGKPLPGTPVVVAHRSDGSGTTYIFTSYLSAVSPAWKQKVGAAKSVNWPTGVGGSGNPGVAGLIKNTPGTIGYVELAYAVQNKLTYGPVRNLAGDYVEASIAGTTAAANAAAAAIERDVRTPIVDGPGAQTYPIAGFTYLLVPGNPKNAAKAKALSDFLTWAMHDGAPLAQQLLYAPLPPSVVKINEAALAKIGTGAQ